MEEHRSSKPTMGVRIPLGLPFLGSIVQWIEHEFPKLKMKVRFLLGPP
jgi:hypothetical protein